MVFAVVICSVVAVVQSLSCVWPLCNPTNCSMPCPSLSPWVGSDSCAPLSFAFNLSQNQGLFQWVDSSHQGAKVLEYWSFSFSISPSNQYSGLISFRIDWFDLLQSKGFSRVFSRFTIWKHHMTPGKTKTLALLAKWHFCFLICCLKYSEGDGIFHHFCIGLDLSSSYCCHCFSFPKPIRVSIVYIDFLCSSGEFW